MPQPARLPVADRDEPPCPSQFVPARMIPVGRVGQAGHGRVSGKELEIADC